MDKQWIITVDYQTVKKKAEMYIFEIWFTLIINSLCEDNKKLNNLLINKCLSPFPANQVPIFKAGLTEATPVGV